MYTIFQFVELVSKYTLGKKGIEKPQNGYEEKRCSNFTIKSRT